MKAITISLSVILFALVLASVVKAEIYETVDKEGNPVFSDTPSQGAKEVELPAENIADAPPPSTRPAEPAREPLSEQDVKQHKTWKDQVGEDGQDSEEEDEVDTILIHDYEHDRIERERLKKIKGQEPIKAPKLKPRTLPSR